MWSCQGERWRWQPQPKNLSHRQSVSSVDCHLLRIKSVCIRISQHDYQVGEFVVYRTVPSKKVKIPLYILSIDWIYSHHLTTSTSFYSQIQGKLQENWLETNFHLLAKMTSLSPSVPKRRENVYKRKVWRQKLKRPIFPNRFRLFICILK